MEKDKKSGINITNNFNAPIGQHIDHVDTINFSMDGEGNFQFGMVENANNLNRPDKTVPEKKDELFHFVHPELDDNEAWRVHNAVKRIVMHQKVKEICEYLKGLNKDRKVLLPKSPNVVYQELVRLGMPHSDGFGEKNFSACYKL